MPVNPGNGIVFNIVEEFNRLKKRADKASVAPLMTGRRPQSNPLSESPLTRVYKKYGITAEDRAR